MNEQGSLFEQIENITELPPRNMIEEMKDEKSFLSEATDFARNVILPSFSNHTSQLTTDDLIEALVDKFGYGVRLYLFDISENLLEEQENVAEFAKYHLGIDQLRKALSGKHEKLRAKDESTLDELFARTLELQSSDKFKDVIRFVAALREYSPFNNMLVKLQRPTARYYATASHWKKKFRRTINDDAIPIVILRPMGPVMLVYEVDDTQGKPLPKQIEDPFSVQGNFNNDYFWKRPKNC